MTADANPSKILRHDQGIQNQYIVVLKTGTPVAAVHGIAQSLASSYNVTITEVWPYTLQGFGADGPDENFAAMSDDPRVEYVEQNVPTGMPPQVSGMQWTWFNNQYLWHLDRIDDLTRAEADSKYYMCTEAQQAVAYIIDSGVYAHNEFESSRLLLRLNFAGTANGQTDTTNGCTPTGGASHGTMVASALAGTHVGAAKPGIVSLRVFDCNMAGTATDMIQAVEWIGSPANPYRNRVGVINHSGFVPTWDGNFAAYGNTVSNLVTNTGIPFFTSADNYSTNACQFSPNDRAYTRVNRTGRVFVVGGTSTDTTDTVNDFRYQTYNNGVPRRGGGSGSNGGPCVSIYAPAVSIYVARNTGPNAYGRYDGTSFASPLAAGIAVRYMQRQKNLTGQIPGYAQVYDFLLAQSVTPVVNTNTAATYWMCVLPDPNRAGWWSEVIYDTRPVACDTGWLGPYQFNYATNTSDARMLYWDEGTCP
jgi:hypothetical protein